MNLYVVTANGWLSGYGAEIYLIGVFDDYEMAEKALSNVEARGGFGKITRVYLNNEHPLNLGGFMNEELSNNFYLGGYCE